MSTLRVVGNTARQAQEPVARAILRSVQSQLATRRFSAPVIAIGGLVLLQIISLILSALVSQNAYRLADLKQTNRELTTQTEILAAEVDSLASQQNLANAAHALGMVSNSNPVFLRLADQKVIGKPKAAFASDGHAASNLVPNSTLTARTDIGAIKKASIAAAAEKLAAKQMASTKASAKTPVANQISAVGTLASTGSIKPSPTR